MAEEAYRLREVDGEEWKDILVALQDTGFNKDEVRHPEPGDYWWLVMKGDEAVACAALVPYKGMGSLSRVVVHPSHQGQGLHRRLIRARVRKAKKLGLSACFTTTYENPPSANNLIKCGFLQYTPTSKWKADGTDYWILEL